MAARRPRLLVLNQYYWPGVEATAHLLSELCEALAADFDVTVVTGRLLGHDELPDEEERNGVRIVRVRSTAYERSQLHLRAANYVTYLAESVRCAVRERRPDLVLCMTDPPIVGDVGLLVARRFAVPLLVITQDVFPEVAVQLERLENPVLVGVLRSLVGLYLRRADRIVAIGETMKRRLEQKGAAPERITVIPNWVDAQAIAPQPLDNAWARRHELAGRFVVMHSGNVGHAQDLETLVRSATFLRDLDDLRIVIVGFGARHAATVALAEHLDVGDLVRFLPYQSRDVLSQSLSAARLHFVGLAKGLAGYVVPSRVYGILAAGRPVVVGADADSETARLVAEIGCGVVVPPGRPELVAGTIRDAYDGKLDLEGMGARGRAYVEAEADRSVAIGRYRRLVSELTSS
ncbi:MAG TPA: glycosyltransferase family 4 protein [Gaiellaceae bacterium]|nr:glycosyltransferase family 4 protein [Gaiellaceae bacterium]